MVHLVTPLFLTENFLVIELDGVDTLVLLAGGYVFLWMIQQVVVYLAGSNRFNLTPLEMLLEIAEIGGGYTSYGMVTVTHLRSFSR